MNKLVYLGAAVVIVLVVAAVFLASGAGLFHSTPTTTVATTSQVTTALVTTVPTTTVLVTTVQSTTVQSTTSTYQTTTVNAASSGCTSEKNFTCSNFTYSYSPSNSTYTISALISQNVSTFWSGFGIGYAPEGTSVSDGVPSITFYTTNSSSASNVGTNLSPGQLARILLKGKGLNAATNGTLWVCYATSGLLYVGNGCLVEGGSPATYVPIATITAS